MLLNANGFQMTLYVTIQGDIQSSMNPQVQAKNNAFQTIERYIRDIPFANTPFSNYGPNFYADHQTVKEHFCSFWKRELGLSSTERVKLEEIFERSVTVGSHHSSNTPYLIFADENNVISIQSMEDAIFDALDLMQ